MVHQTHPSSTVTTDATGTTDSRDEHTYTITHTHTHTTSNKPVSVTLSSLSGTNFLDLFTAPVLKKVGNNNDDLATMLKVGRAEEKGDREGRQRWETEMGDRDGRQRREKEMEERDGRQRWEKGGKEEERENVCMYSHRPYSHTTAVVLVAKLLVCVFFVLLFPFCQPIKPIKPFKPIKGGGEEAPAARTMARL